MTTSTLRSIGWISGKAATSPSPTTEPSRSSERAGRAAAPGVVVAQSSDRVGRWRQRRARRESRPDESPGGVRGAGRGLDRPRPGRAARRSQGRSDVGADGGRGRLVVGPCQRRPGGGEHQVVGTARPVRGEPRGQGMDGAAVAPSTPNRGNRDVRGAVAPGPDRRTHAQGLRQGRSRRGVPGQPEARRGRRHALRSRGSGPRGLRAGRAPDRGAGAATSPQLRDRSGRGIPRPPRRLVVSCTGRPRTVARAVPRRVGRAGRRATPRAARHPSRSSERGQWLAPAGARP